MASRRQYETSSRQTIAYAVFVGMTFGLAISIVSYSRKSEGGQSNSLRDVLTSQVGVVSDARSPLLVAESMLIWQMVLYHVLTIAIPCRVHQQHRMLPGEQDWGWTWRGCRCPALLTITADCMQCQACTGVDQHTACHKGQLPRRRGLRKAVDCRNRVLVSAASCCAGGGVAAEAGDCRPHTATRCHQRWRHFRPRGEAESRAGGSHNPGLVGKPAGGPCQNDSTEGCCMEGAGTP